MILSKTLSNKSFAVYGLGVTGLSVLNCLKKSKVKNFYLWDDDKTKRNSIKIKLNIKDFLKSLKFVDYIIISPGINIRKSKHKKILEINESKIITDLDLFFMSNKYSKSIVVTGTNGKSTTCKIIKHLLKKNNLKTKLGGNIGNPILSLDFKKKTFVIIEASSFQLAYSKYIKPDYALILNITKDHLEWHGNLKNYIDSKFKVFSLQAKNNFAILSDSQLIKKFKKGHYLSKLVSTNSKEYKKIKERIQNEYLSSKANEENMNFAYSLSKLFKIKTKKFINSFNSFKGLPHRNEIFLKTNNIKFINDSKATSFEASKLTLESNKNIFWILGGLPKKGDRFYLKNLKTRIIKSYIIGKNVKFYKKQLKNNIKFEVSKTLKKCVISIFKDIKKFPFKPIVVLLSPSGASYDQYDNFGERGDDFKKLVLYYGNKYS